MQANILETPTKRHYSDLSVESRQKLSILLQSIMEPSMLHHGVEIVLWNIVHNKIPWS